jgi:hypothetical protein
MDKGEEVMPVPEGVITTTDNWAEPTANEEEVVEDSTTEEEEDDLPELS